MRLSRHRRTAPHLSVIAVVALSLLVAGCAGVNAGSGKGKVGTADAKYVQAMRMAESVRAGGDPASATAFYSRAHEIDPSQAAPLVGLAETAAALGSTDKALELFREAITLSSNDGSLHRKYAGLLLKSGKPAQALEAYREALAIEPNDGKALNGIAVSLDLLGRPGEAREAYTRALALSPHDPGIRSNLALSQALAGQHDEAVAQLTQLASEPSADARTRQNLALALALRGQIADAAGTASRDLSEAELRNAMALYRSLAKLPQQERAALVFGIAGRLGGSSANLAGLTPRDLGNARVRRQPPMHQATPALASDGTGSAAETPAPSGEGAAASSPVAVASAPVNVTPAPASESTANANAAAAAAEPIALPMAVAAHDPVTDPVLPAPAEPLVLPVTLRGGTARPSGSAAASTGLGFSFIEPSRPGRPTALTQPQAAAGILVLEIEKGAPHVEAPLDAPGADAVAAAPVSIPATN